MKTPQDKKRLSYAKDRRNTYGENSKTFTNTFPMNIPPRYSEWLLHVFDHDVTDPQWYFDLEAPGFEASDIEIAQLITCTMANCGRDLADYTDAQVNQGLNYIFNNSCSNFVFAITDGEYAMDIKVQAIHSIKSLYSDCFETRCAPVLSHLNESSSSKLKSVCYMLWDMTPLNDWEGRPEKQIAYDAVVDVMESALTSKNPACLESALHGLGHTQTYCPERIGPIIERFLEARVELRQELKSYAKNAAIGNVQ